ncbi:MAG: glycosyl hydrolase-related protein, partial [bacterium]
DVRVEFENNARDHRLRAVFPTPFNVESAVADSAFEHVSRPLKPPKGDDWRQKPGNTHPMQSFFDISDGKAGLADLADLAGLAGLAILARGLPEYEARKTRNGTTGYLTLLRCVGVLSRKSLPARPEQAGPDLPTPEAQCPGSHRFEYSIFPHGGGGIGEVFARAAAFNCPLLGVPAGNFHDGDAIVAEAEATGGLIIREIGKVDSPLPDSGSPLCGSLVSIKPAALVATALRLRENGRLEMRFFNSSKEKAETKIETFMPVESVEKVNFLGEREGEQPKIAGSNLITLKVTPWEIVTLHVKFKTA